VLLNDYSMLLPPAQTVVEVIEAVTADQEVVAACRRLKESGYSIARDDFVMNDPGEPLIELADLIKVDMRATSRGDARDLSKRYGSKRRSILAKKVETREEFVVAKEAGFVYFQGYFFQKPEVLTSHDIPANLVNYLLMLEAVSQSDLDVRAIERLIKSEASRCYRLLRYLNSAAFVLGTEIHSVRHALSILGEREIRRWIRLVATLGAGQNRSSDMVLAALVRARFCELLSPKIQHGDSDLFLMGMLSMMEAILQIPMSQVLDHVPIDHESKAVLLGEDSRLRPLDRLMLARESGKWELAAVLGEQLHLSEREVVERHWGSDGVGTGRQFWGLVKFSSIKRVSS